MPKQARNLQKVNKVKFSAVEPANVAMAISVPEATRIDFLPHWSDSRPAMKAPTPMAIKPPETTSAIPPPMETPQVLISEGKTWLTSVPSIPSVKSRQNMRMK